MIASRLIDDKEILSLVQSGDFANAACLLLKSQRKEWTELAHGYENLELVKTKSLWFDGFKINLQYNPGRLKSTSADVDKDIIENRACFLCDENLPTEQKGIKILDKYILLCNPYPVFPEHFTVATADHKPQEILTSFYDFILISKMLGSKYTLIYNGPDCGASAPDHLHFQAGTKQFMPIENDFHSLKNEYGETIAENEKLIATGIDDSIRKFISLETNDEKILIDAFNRFYEAYDKLCSNGEEPMMNLTCNYDENGWRVIIFLRSKHRSSHYYLAGEKRIMLSPAAIDLGGVGIMPVKKDFEMIDAKTIRDIYSEVFITEDEAEYLKAALGKTLTR